MRYCIFCGVEIPKDAKYCQICGKMQPENTASKEEELPEVKTGLATLLDSPQKMIIAGIGGFLTVLILATVIMILVLK